MSTSGKKAAVSLSILIAEDDPDDRFILQRAFRELRVAADLRFVEDGGDLMGYLLRKGRYADAGTAPRPDLILLDLNMPHKDGREALGEIKSDFHLRDIHIVIWTTSKQPEDRDRCSKAGANCYVTKPARYADLLETVRELCRKFLPAPC
jgi:CheY-like chemotaxis protein